MAGNGLDTHFYTHFARVEQHYPTCPHMVIHKGKEEKVDQLHVGPRFESGHESARLFLETTGRNGPIPGQVEKSCRRPMAAGDRGDRPE